MTQAELQQKATAFYSKWIGKRTNPDGAYGYQCVDLVKQYLIDVFATPQGSWGNAIDYWYHTHPTILGKFYKQTGTSAIRGDLVVFETNVVPIVKGKQPGHIGVATGNQTSTSLEVMEQNGGTGNGSGLGNDAIRTRFISKHRVAGLLRPRVTAVQPPSGHPYAQYVGRVVRLEPYTNHWNFYAVGSVAPRTPKGFLNPQKYGGLEYRIEATDRSANSVIITTSMFGKVSLPIGDYRGNLYSDARIK